MTAVGAVRSSVLSHGCQKHLSKQQLSQNLLSLSSKPSLCPWFSGGTAQHEGWDLLAIPFGRSLQNAWYPRLSRGGEEIPGCCWKHKEETWQRADVLSMPLPVRAPASGDWLSANAYPVNCHPVTVTSWQWRTLW